MAKRAHIDFAGRKTVILGSGGASLTARAVVRDMGASETVIISRSGEDNYSNIHRHYDAEIIVNTTPVGMYPGNGEKLLELGRFQRCAGVLDLIYNPRRTALIIEAEKLGIANSDGLPMLVAQAVAAEEHFTGKKIDESETERILACLRRDMTNIVLIGMPGSGKTTVGRLLARLTGREAIDLDEQIVQRAGRSVPEIFADEGEGAFRELEREAAAEAGKLSGRIILTGGGVVKDVRNYAPLHQNGRIYLLKRNLSLLPSDGRPLSQGADLAEMWAERKPLYEAFKDAEAENNAAAEQTATAIWSDFCENSCD